MDANFAMDKRNIIIWKSLYFSCAIGKRIFVYTPFVLIKLINLSLLDIDLLGIDTVISLTQKWE